MDNNIKININGKDYCFFLGLMFIAEFVDKRGIDFEEIDEKINNRNIPFIIRMMYESGKIGAEIEGLPFDLNYFQFLNETQIDNAITNGKIGQFTDALISRLHVALPNEEPVPTGNAKPK